MISNVPPTLSSSNVQVNDNISQRFNAASTRQTTSSLRASDSQTNRHKKLSLLAPKPPEVYKEEPSDIRVFDSTWLCQSPPQVGSLDRALLQKEEVSETPGSSLRYMSGKKIGSEYRSDPDRPSFDIFEQCSSWPQSDSRTCIPSPNPNKRPAKRGEGFGVPQKRSRTSEHDENTAELNEDVDPRLGGDDVENRKGETFACPYYRKDPERHLECINLRMARISDVKQHLKRKHTARYNCLRCSEGFSSQKVYDHHIRQENCCQDSAANIDCVSPAAQDAIKVRFERSLSSKEQWYKIWEVLFGKQNPTMDPYLDNIFKEVTGIIRSVWKKEGDQIISSSIRGRELPSCNDQLHSLLLEFLNKVETRFEQKPSETNSRESTLNSDISLVENMVRTNSEPNFLPATTNPFSSDGIFPSYALPSEMSSSPVNFSSAEPEGAFQTIKNMFNFSIGSPMPQVEYPMEFSTADLQMLGEAEPWIAEGEPHLNNPNN
ncbi:hypothetical protein FSHL1_009739 [Fusarium sambucinum]